MKMQTNDSCKRRGNYGKRCFWKGFLFFSIRILGWFFSITTTIQALNTISQNFCGSGIVSLHLIEGETIVAGTKNGNLYYSYSGVDENWSVLDSDSICETNVMPIYSLASSDSYLFCGGANRYISVWKTKASKKEEHDEEKKQKQQSSIFQYKQRLGPHTGWVKALVCDQKSRLLHSVGCNCIESWDLASTPITHVSRRTIENSPTMGTTLSSDLLCLCLVTTKTEDAHPLLVSGGVDGRIHLWPSDPNRHSYAGQPLESCQAHDGRVNVILYSNLLNAIFTVGNDGAISAFRIRSSGSNIGLELLHRLKVSNDYSSETRLTSALFVNETQDRCTIALGSHTGTISFVTVQNRSDNGVAMSGEPSFTIIQGNPVIYDFCYQGTKDPPRLWIGHATGIASLDFILNIPKAI
jgi:hypothetical protein